MRHRPVIALRSSDPPWIIFGSCRRQLLSPVTRRYAQVQATPSVSTDDAEGLIYGNINSAPAPSPDAQFEVLGHPYSLLSVKLSPSQNLHTRRGSLVAVQGRPEDAISTLSFLGPLRRSLLGIPFLYQRISSTSSLTALISSKSAISTFSVIHLDGRLDWIVAQRTGLLAWTGHTLSITPKLNTRMSVAHWGNSHITGRGLVALVGKGQIYSVNLKANEQYLVHPSNVLAYTVNTHPPLPYRFKSSNWRLQIPSMTSWIPDTRFFQAVRQSKTWKTLVASWFTLQTWARRTIWGDRLFLQFQGPMTILLQSRGSSLTDVLTSRDVNEVAEAPAGAVQDAVALDLRKESAARTAAVHSSVSAPPASSPQPTSLRMATVRGGKVDFSGT